MGNKTKRNNKKTLKLNNNFCNNIKMENNYQYPEEETKVFLFSESQNDKTTEVFIYLQDLNEDGELFFNVDYEIQHKNGSFENGNGLVELDVILAAYGFEDYKKLSAYFRYMFEHDSDAFKKVIADIKSKGVNISVDESEGFEGNGGFAMWG